MTHDYAKQEVAFPRVSYVTAIKLHDHCSTLQTWALAQIVVRSDHLTNAAQSNVAATLNFVSWRASGLQ